MFQRTSIVDAIKVRSVSIASTIQLGDSRIINGFSRALAVQREAEVFFGKEGNFSSYPVFSDPIPFQPLTESLAYSTHHFNPSIKVQNIDITGVSSSSLLHVGNSEHISLEARVKHIRQLLPTEEEGEH
jgi:spore germination protein PE